MERATMLKRMDEDNVLCVLTEPDCDGLVVLTDGIAMLWYELFVMVRAATSVSVVESRPGALRRAKPSTFDLRPSTFDLRPSPF
jgi:hypothetical protein